MALKGYYSIEPNGGILRHRIRNCKSVNTELPYREIPNDAKRCNECYAGNFVLYAIDWARRLGRNSRRL